MRPDVKTPAHETGFLAELVCSNSLKSNSPETLAGLLKQNLSALDSIVIRNAVAHSVPAGKALAVDRVKFAQAITLEIEKTGSINIIRKEIAEIPDGYENVIIATGPLTSDRLSSAIKKIIGEEELFFYDAIAPIIEADSVDMSIAFRQDRYNKAGEGDYINLPMTKTEYETFVETLLGAEQVMLREFEEGYYFEGCLPIEEIALRGKDSLAFGPLKPVGLENPHSDAKPYAVVQLRKETRAGDACNIVGFQTKLKYHEQQRVFKTIPGLSDAKFLRFGSLHRNTYIHSPIALEKDLTLKKAKKILMAGQITGVEGYVESAAIGLLAGMIVADRLEGKEFNAPPETTTIGALLRYITEGPDYERLGQPKNRSGAALFQPTNINFSLFPPLAVHEKKRKARRQKVLERAAEDFEQWRRL